MRKSILDCSQQTQGLRQRVPFPQESDCTFVGVSGSPAVEMYFETFKLGELKLCSSILRSLGFFPDKKKQQSQLNS